MMKASNFALLTKWLWRYHTELDALQKSIIDAKYSKAFIGCLPEYGKYSSSNAPWRSIIKGKDWFNSKITWTINSRGSDSFWQSNWTNNMLLYQKAPRLYALSSCKEATVKEVWDPGTSDWNFKPRRPLNERETNAWKLLKNSLPTITQNSTDDRPVWNKESNGIYTTISAKKSLLGRISTLLVNTKPKLQKSLGIHYSSKM